MATSRPQDIFEKDPKSKWDGGEPDKLLGKNAGSEQFKAALYKEQRVLKQKVDKLTKMLATKNLSTAERYALQRSLSESNKAIQTVADNSKKELEFLKKSGKFQQDSARKLSALQSFMAEEAKKKTGPKNAAQVKAEENRTRLLEALDQQLRNLGGKDVGTAGGRLGTLKALTRIDKLMQDLPADLQKMFAEQEEFTTTAISEQRKMFEEEAKTREQERKAQERKADEERKEREAAAKEAREERLKAGYEAHKTLQEQHKQFKSMIGNKALGLLDRVGLGSFNAGNLTRGIIGANNARKSWRDGKTGIQKYAQNRALAKGGDPSKLKYGLGRVEKEAQDPETAYRAMMASKSGGTVDQIEGSDSEKEISDTLKAYAAENARFNARMLEAVKQKNKQDAAANDEGGFGMGGMGGGMLKNLAGLLPGLMPAVLLALPAALLLKLGLDQKNKIEANPNAPEFKDNTYAMKLRGEADNLGQAAAMNQQKALKVLQPGVAKQYLEAGADKDGKYLDGYSKEQLEDMAAGKKPSGMDSFNKIKTGAQQASANSVGGDDNGEANRMAKRSAVAISGGAPTADTVQPDAGGYGGGGKSLPGGGNAGAGGMIKDGMGKIFTKSSGVDTDGLNPQMQSKFAAMGQEYTEKTGKKINFNSGYRSIEDQAKLYKTMKPGMAAKPGSSLHNYGLAVDIPSSTANELDQLGLLGKYGFERPIPGEKWHIQPKGVSVAAAKSGIYSADAPADQGAPKDVQVAQASPSAPTVSDASVEPPTQSGATGGQQTASAAGTTGGASGNVSGSVASIPTFDSSDGMFLALNMGVV